jgi:hypothetical protein
VELVRLLLDKSLIASALLNPLVELELRGSQFN